MKSNTKMALFTGVFVAIVRFFIEFSNLDLNIIVIVLITALSALIGALIGNKLFPSK